MAGTIRRVGARWLDALVFAAGGVAAGMFIGIVVAGQADIADYSKDPTDYQNFAVATGAITGLLCACLGLLLYALAAKRGRFRLGRLLVFSATSGAAITLVTYCISTALAPQYGMVERTGALTVADGVLSSIVGGGLGAGLAAGMSAIRGYGE